MKIRLLGAVIMGGRSYGKGAVIEGKERDLQPLVDTGAAERDDTPARGPLAGVDWASDRGAEVAAEFGLDAADFEGHEPTGSSGWTVADVRRVNAAREA